MDIDKQIDYWRTSSLEDLDAAQALVKVGKYRHGLFLAHLALEKMLKAHVCRTTGDVPPRIHTLPTLAARAGLALPKSRSVFLSMFDRYQMQGRYPEPRSKGITKARAALEMRHCGEVIAWLLKKF